MKKCEQMLLIIARAAERIMGAQANTKGGVRTV